MMSWFFVPFYHTNFAEDTNIRLKYQTHKQNKILVDREKRAMESVTCVSLLCEKEIETNEDKTKICILEWDFHKKKRHLLLTTVNFS